MSGHSNWVRLRQQTAKQAVNQPLLFKKLAKQIVNAVRLEQTSSTPVSSLFNTVEKARSYGMSQAQVASLLTPSTDNSEAGNAPLFLEGTGPDGVALYIECLTDDPEKTRASVEHVLGQFGGALSESGSVNYLFREQGVISVHGIADEAELLENSLDAGATEVLGLAEGAMEVLTAPETMSAVRTSLTERGIEVSHAESVMVPVSEHELEGGNATRFLMMMDALDALEDICSVYANADIPDHVLSHLAE